MLLAGSLLDKAFDGGLLVSICQCAWQGRSRCCNSSAACWSRRLGGHDTLSQLPVAAAAWVLNTAQACGSCVIILEDCCLHCLGRRVALFEVGTSLRCGHLAYPAGPPGMNQESIFGERWVIDRSLLSATRCKQKFYQRIAQKTMSRFPVMRT